MPFVHKLSVNVYPKGNVPRSIAEAEQFVIIEIKLDSYDLGNIALVY